MLQHIIMAVFGLVIAVVGAAYAYYFKTAFVLIGLLMVVGGALGAVATFKRDWFFLFVVNCCAPPAAPRSPPMSARRSQRACPYTPRQRAGVPAGVHLLRHRRHDRLRHPRSRKQHPSRIRRWPLQRWPRKPKSVAGPDVLSLHFGLRIVHIGLPILPSLPIRQVYDSVDKTWDTVRPVSQNTHSLQRPFNLAICTMCMPTSCNFVAGA